MSADLLHTPAAGQPNVDVVVEEVAREALDVVDHAAGRVEARPFRRKNRATG